MNLKFFFKLSSGLSFSFIALLIVSGWGLSAGYIPSEAEAFSSILYLRKMGGIGQAIRSLHFYLSSGLIVSGFFFLITFYLLGYTKSFAKEWYLSLIIYFMIIGSCFTGYILPMDQNAYWGTQVRLGIVETIPIVGTFIADILRGGSSFGSETLSRFFTIHGSIIPLFLTIILMLLIQSNWALIRPIIENSKVIVGSTISIGIIYIFTFYQHAPLELPANPIDAEYIPRPEWYFLWLFEFGKYVEWAPWIRSALLPIGGILFLFSIPNLKTQTQKLRLQIAGAWCSIWIILTGLTLYADQKLPEKLEYEKAMIIQAEENYQNLCYDCHGITGSGDGPQTLSFDLETPDFTSTDYGENTNTKKMIKAIRLGKGKDMPGFKKKLTQYQTESMVDYIQLTFLQK
ncbi:MAG: hypothetical protein HOB40_10035 [Candidatus Marinimicrobia bacterium]|jgi:ubiquinol-cytochrome c reductase cytochrome b subunit|nr:hypothetical protein [Candidatus Neomarinimicrobiota bacterium]MBT3502752.1 hypothetical protein [Candidatus Neomarinimicrobiota bacterium]MBT3838936.1 hypothetical protein [Candidatus Neomarinimicrobiota bacterium]MBT4000360.1 hypothetical protein [Candidatus Neomarinimicrobiota bacterium]MBT4283432.1 hypothetical protein [Candidatus Neomarinimicrobiota bacterium]